MMGSGSSPEKKELRDIKTLVKKVFKKQKITCKKYFTLYQKVSLVVLFNILWGRAEVARQAHTVLKDCKKTYSN